MVIQDNVSKRWNIPGVTTERRIAEDGISRSFLFEKEDGRVVIRNSRFLKHSCKTPRKHMSWNVPGSAVGGAEEADLSNE